MRHIENKRILNIGTRLTGFADGAEIRIVTDVTDGMQDKLTRIGYSDPPVSGETLLPPALGPVSRFNSRGKWRVYRDRPKEERYMWTVHWTWTTWDGTEHADDRDIYRQCYQRDLIPPPALELTYTEQGGKKRVVSEILVNNVEEQERIRHAVNLLLELFGTCDIVHADLDRQESIPIKRINWHLLPPGEYPWDRLGEHLDAMLRRRSERVAAAIRNRQEAIKALGPDVIHVGAGGFKAYMAYVFQARGLVVLEALEEDNALYVFGTDWQRVSQLSKAQVIAGNLHLARIIHTQGWERRLAQLFDVPKAAE